jgi:3-polyprenyl-4-hydroxybenzoate decarboxylase
LHKTLGIKGIKKVVMHEPLTNIRRVIFLVMEQGTPRTEIYRAMQGAATLRADTGKYVIAVNEDIDPDNADAVFWSMAYRANPGEDVVILPHRDRGHGPKSKTQTEDSSMLIDATLKGDMPPLALPKREYMENAKVLWDSLGLPPLAPEPPWYGYSMGDWSEDWDNIAKRAAEGNYILNGQRTDQMKRSNIKPNTPVRDVKND